MARQTASIALGDRRELFVDEFLIESLSGSAEQRLHEPVPRELALRTDRSWEGNMSTYFTVLDTGELYRLYYIGFAIELSEMRERDEGTSAEPHPMWVCVAESENGMDWRRPELGIVEHASSGANNIVWSGAGEKQHGVHGFAPFRDTNPNCRADERFKALGADRKAFAGHLYAMVSADGLRWRLHQDEPVMLDGRDGSFDSQNTAFWDSVAGCYRAYVRDFSGGPPGAGGIRAIKTAVSRDFRNWTDIEWLEYPGSPPEELYTNQVTPYYRAPHIYLGFPSRYVQRPWSPTIEALPERASREALSAREERYGTALTDGLFMASRDGRTFYRRPEVFLRPGPQLEHRWFYGDNYQCWGLIETPSALPGAPDELSFFVRESRWRGNSVDIRRYSLRKDGFVSVHADLSGGELITPELRFTGEVLEMNFATSAAGSIRVELQDPEGKPVRGFSADDCYEQVGDELDRTVFWKGGSSVVRLAGRGVRLRFLLKDADLYSIRFRKNGGESL
jgi:hypothetical protein